MFGICIKIIIVLYICDDDDDHQYSHQRYHANIKSWKHELGVGDVCERIPQLPVCPTYLVTEVILVIIVIIILVILVINNLVIVIMIIVVIKTIIGDCAGSAVFGFRASSS